MSIMPIAIDKLSLMVELVAAAVDGSYIALHEIMLLTLNTC